MIIFCQFYVIFSEHTGKQTGKNKTDLGFVGGQNHCKLMRVTQLKEICSDCVKLCRPNWAQLLFSTFHLKTKWSPRSGCATSSPHPATKKLKQDPTNMASHKLHMSYNNLIYNWDFWWFICLFLLIWVCFTD